VEPAAASVVELKLGDSAASVPVHGAGPDAGHQGAGGGVGDPQLRQGRSGAPIADQSHGAGPPAWNDHIDFAAMAEGFRIKSAACDWASGNQAYADLASLITRARALPDCFIWHEQFGSGVSVEAWQTIKLCYDNLASYCDLWSSSQHGLLAGTYRPLRQILKMGMMLQQMLRRSLRDHTTLLRPDTQQETMYRWLQRMAWAHGEDFSAVLRDAANSHPSQATGHARTLAVWHDMVAGRATRDAAAVKSPMQAAKQAYLNRIRYHLRRDPMADSDWVRVLETVAEWRSEALYATDPDFVDVIQPVLEPLIRRVDLLEDQDAAEKVAEFLERLIPDDVGDTASAEESTHDPQVAQVRDMQAGRPLIIFGGNRHAEAERRLSRALHCPMKWHGDGKFKRRGKGFVDRVVARAARRGAAVVVLRWRGHHLGWDIKAACKSRGVPFAVVPSGYSPASIARALLDRGYAGAGVT
jgi:hypothetical protein